MNKEKLKQIIEIIYGIQEEITEKIKAKYPYPITIEVKGFSPDMILDCATRIYNNEYSKEKKEESESEPATAKQLGLITKLGLKINKNLTKKEAQVLIKENMDKRDNY